MASNAPPLRMKPRSKSKQQDERPGIQQKLETI